MSEADELPGPETCPACERELRRGARARLWEGRRVHPACFNALRAKYQVTQGITYSSKKPSTYSRGSRRSGRMS